MLEVNKVHNMDALDGLKLLDDNSVDCIVTSPPYYQLRDYGHGGQIGLENTVHEYIDKLSDVFMECYRVLKPTGTMWLNISDTYNGSKKGNTDNKLKSHIKEVQNINKKKSPQIKYKSLMGVPSRLLIRLIDSGWVLRNEIIWHKPNAMPSSAKDRFTIDHETIYFFTKSPIYEFNQLKESMKSTDINPPRGSNGVIGSLNLVRRKQSELGKSTYTGFNDRYEVAKDLMRNVRTVWSISTESSVIPHFAMYPKELVKRCIESGCVLGGLVLDPFMGSGTTAIVSKMMNRSYIGFEINEVYCKDSQKRIDMQPILLDIFNI